MLLKRNRGVATLLIATLVAQCIFVSDGTKAESDVENTIIYSDGIQFEVEEDTDKIVLTGKYEGQVVEIVQNDENESLEATISDGTSIDSEYTLEIQEDIENVNSVDIDELYDCEDDESVVQSVQNICTISDSVVNVYEENELVDVIELDNYEGQCMTLVATGTASYYLLSLAVTVLITYKAVTIYQSVKSNNSGKTRGEGREIDKNKVPNRKNKNEVVIGTSLPRKGEPNSSKDLINKNTHKLSQRRFYDENGDACLDVDFSHGGNHKFPHVHFWE